MEGSAGGIRVLLVDDHPAVVEGLRAALEVEPGIEVVGTAPDAGSARARFGSTRPDVVVLDHQLPDGDGIHVATALKAQEPRVRILLLTASDDPQLAEAAIRSGCDGFLTKRASPGQLVDAVRRVHRGDALFEADVLVRALRAERAVPDRHDLSDRELEVLRLLAVGRSTDEIAEALYVSTNTVRSHVRRILEKLGAHSKLAAVAAAVRSGILDLGDFEDGSEPDR